MVRLAYGWIVLVLLPLLCGAGADAPPASLVALAEVGEPGEKLTFWGQVLDSDGRPLAKASVLAYHADRAGLYNAPGTETRVPRLRGVAVTDSGGRFGFASIRPGPYPDGTEPAHLHLTVTAPAHRVRDIEFWFRGDAQVTPARIERAAGNPSIVVVDLEPDPEGGWRFRHDIRLEAN